MFRRSRSRAMIHRGRMAATMGRNLVEMKKNNTSRHFADGLDRQRVGGRDGQHQHEDGRDTDGPERVAEGLTEAKQASGVGRHLIELDESSGSKKSLGSALASASSLNPLRTIQKTGKKMMQGDDPGQQTEERST